MTEQLEKLVELRKEILEAVCSPSSRCCFKSTDGECSCYCQPSILTDRILALPLLARALAALEELEAGRLVRLADDQSVPENPYCFEDANFEHMAYGEGQSDMTHAGFRRVEAEGGEQQEAPHD